MTLLDFMRDTNNWRAPEFTKIMAQFGWKSKNQVFRELKKLQKLGFLDERYKPIQVGKGSAGIH